VQWHVGVKHSSSKLFWALYHIPRCENVNIYIYIYKVNINIEKYKRKEGVGSGREEKRKRKGKKKKGKKENGKGVRGKEISCNNDTTTQAPSTADLQWINQNKPTYKDHTVWHFVTI
jgi:hypothetical protein